MKLSNYRSKRNFSATPEPSESQGSPGSRLYVIQKHAARRLHYDFRLEHDGVLLSWAVPKGPSLDPAVKRLAVHVEDHPVSYGSFSGIIPAGNYGAGKVEIWDTGEWEPLGSVDEMLAKGSLKFEIHGKRLRGKWALVKMAQDEKNWLLIKEKDAFAVPGDADKVLDRAKALPKLHEQSIQDFRPQLAVSVETLPEGDGWFHEIKYDGYRILAWNLDDGVHLMSRNGLDWTKRFPHIANVIERYLPKGTGLDGEIVVFSPSGISDFGKLQQWLKDGQGDEPKYMVFDLVRADSADVTGLRLVERKAILREMLHHLADEAGSVIRYSEHIVGQGKRMAAEACRNALEGVVSKEADSRYIQGRSNSWRKFKCVKQEEFVVCGYTAPTGSRHGFGSLILGQHNATGGLDYAGRVGTGFDDRDLESLFSRLQKLVANESPFGRWDAAPGVEQWVKPELVVQARYAERTKSGVLRHAVFVGLREDKAADDVFPEKEMNKLPVEITHPNKVVFPELGLTKLAVAEYYDRVAEAMSPFTKDRPLAIVRCPDGVGEACFFQKHRAAGLPDSVGQKVEGEDQELLTIHSTTDLLTLVQFGAIEFHVWQSTFERLEEPDTVVFDLDPGEGVPWSTVCEAANVLRTYLSSLDLPAFLKVSGGKGLHIVVPIKPGSLTWSEFKSLSHAIANSLSDLVPGQFVTVSTKEKRTKKIFIDYLRNGRGATSIVPYSVRTNEDAAVSVPVRWSELDAIDSPRQFTVQNAEDWFQSSVDAWKDFRSAAVSPSGSAIEELTARH